MPISHFTLLHFPLQSTPTRFRLTIYSKKTCEDPSEFRVAGDVASSDRLWSSDEARSESLKCSNVLAHRSLPSARDRLLKFAGSVLKSTSPKHGHPRARAKARRECTCHWIGAQFATRRR